MLVYTHASVVPLPADQVFAWHESPEALPALLPAFPPARVVRHEGIRNGAVASIEFFTGFSWMRWEALHVDYIPGRQFRDIQLAGPFKRWSHTHLFAPEGISGCRVTDIVECELPGGRVVNRVAWQLLRLALAGMFFQRRRALEIALLKKMRHEPCSA